MYTTPEVDPAMTLLADFPSNRLRVMAGITVAAWLALWGVFEHYESEVAYQAENQDPYQISATFVRLDGLRSAIPENSSLGYLTDAEPRSTVESAMFLAAQYVLAPRLLAKDTLHEWVLGNFTRPADFAALGKSRSLRLQQDFGNGVVLFRRQQ
jgi:hypothetical protein